MKELILRQPGYDGEQRWHLFTNRHTGTWTVSGSTFSGDEGGDKPFTLIVDTMTSSATRIVLAATEIRRNGVQYYGKLTRNL